MRKERRERIEKGSRERMIEIQRKEKETKGNCDTNLKRRRRRNITTCLCLLFSFLEALRYSSEDMSSRLDSAVKRCSSEVNILQRSGLVKGLARRD